jgi:hypothetical protein
VVAPNSVFQNDLGWGRIYAADPAICFGIKIAELTFRLRGLCNAQQATELRKYWPFADGLTYGSNRPVAVVQPRNVEDRLTRQGGTSRDRIGQLRGPRLDEGRSHSAISPSLWTSCGDRSLSPNRVVLCPKRRVRVGDRISRVRTIYRLRSCRSARPA